MRNRCEYTVIGDDSLTMHSLVVDLRCCLETWTTIEEGLKGQMMGFSHSSLSFHTVHHLSDLVFQVRLLSRDSRVNGCSRSTCVIWQLGAEQ